MEDVTSGVVIEGAADPQNSGDKGPGLVGKEPSPAAVGSPAVDEQLNGLRTAVAEERRKRQDTEAQNELLLQQMQMLNANRNAAPAAGPNRTSGIAAQVLERLGLKDVEYLNTEQLSQYTEALNRVQSTVAQQEAFIEAHADFKDVVGATDPRSGMFIPAEPLRRTLEKTPGLADAIQNSPHGARLAYELAKKDIDHKKEVDEAKVPSKKAEEKLAEELAKAGKQSSQQSVSSVPGQGGLDKVTAMQQMSDAEFAAHKAKIMSQAS
jgi:hypothetical protein